MSGTEGTLSIDLRRNMLEAENVGVDCVKYASKVVGHAFIVHFL